MTFKEAIAFLPRIKAYAVRSFSDDPLQKFRFRLSISGYTGILGFKDVSGISDELEVTEYREGTVHYTHKLPGIESVGEVTFSRGMYHGDFDMYQMFKDIMTKRTATRHDVTLKICDRWGNIRRRIYFRECWFSKYETDGVDSSSSDVQIETLTMQYESMTEG